MQNLLRGKEVNLKKALTKKLRAITKLKIVKQTNKLRSNNSYFKLTFKSSFFLNNFILKLHKLYDHFDSKPKKTLMALNSRKLAKI